MLSDFMRKRLVRGVGHSKKIGRCHYSIDDPLGCCTGTKPIPYAVLARVFGIENLVTTTELRSILCDDERSSWSRCNPSTVIHPTTLIIRAAGRAGVSDEMFQDLGSAPVSWQMKRWPLNKR